MLSGRAPRADNKEVAMNPALITAVAAERRRDQMVEAAAARRARQARRPRRGGPVVPAAMPDCTRGLLA
jgi:hypothetical protein